MVSYWQDKFNDFKNWNWILIGKLILLVFCAVGMVVLFAVIGYLIMPRTDLPFYSALFGFMFFIGLWLLVLDYLDWKETYALNHPLDTSSTDSGESCKESK